MRSLQWWVLLINEQEWKGNLKKIRPCGLINEHENNLPNNETVIQQHAILTLTVIQSSLHGFITNKQTKRPTPRWFVSLVGGALHQYHRGHGFKSLTTWILRVPILFRNNLIKQNYIHYFVYQFVPTLKNKWRD